MRIFTVSGQKVKSLPVSHSSITWDMTTDSGQKAASGLYLYLITSGDSKKRGKIAIIQ